MNLDLQYKPTYNTEHKLCTLLSNLIRLPQVSDSIGLLNAQFSELGFATKILNFNGVDNLYAYKNLKSDKGALLFLGHADVVPIGENWSVEQGDVCDSTIWGRGAVDMKGAIVCFIEALRSNPDVPVAVLISGDEEGTAEFGTPAVLSWLREQDMLPQFSFVLIGEPTSYGFIGDRVKFGCRGSLNVSVTAHGVAGHVAYPEFVDNPARTMVKFVDEVAGENALGDSNDYHLEVTSIESASGATNVVPSVARCGFNIRFETNMSAKQLMDQISKIARKYEGVNVSYDVACEPFVSTCESSDMPIFDVLFESIEKVTKRTADVTTRGANSDAKFIRTMAPFVELGLRVDSAHKVDEHVSIEDLTTLTNIYDQFLKDFLCSFIAP
jgi:succinyl-diaminopimelate desuccinylase